MAFIPDPKSPDTLGFLARGNGTRAGFVRMCLSVCVCVCVCVCVRACVRFLPLSNRVALTIGKVLSYRRARLPSLINQRRPIGRSGVTDCDAMRIKYYRFCQGSLRNFPS